MPTLNIYIRPADVELFNQWKTLLAEQRRSLSAAIAETAEAAIRSGKEAQTADSVSVADSNRKSNRPNRAATKRSTAVSHDSVGHGSGKGRKKETEV